MKKIIQLLVIILSANFSLAQTNIYDSIYIGSHWRTFMTHLPTGYNPANHYPLVLAFHGGGAQNYSSLQYQSRLTPKADTAGFVLVYPEGVRIAGTRTWNAGGCCAPSTSLNVDDVGFVSNLLDTLFKARSIVTTRVYATGFSNGSLLCYRLADQIPNRFAAIGPVAGDLVYYPWNPSKAIPIINFHSYLDQNIQYFGGLTVGPSGTYFPPQDSILHIIGTNYSCTVLKDTLYHNTNQYDHFKYMNCACNVVIEQYVSYDGEHSWPGGLPTNSTIAVSTQFSATYLMWQFFQNYTTNCVVTTGVLQNENKLNTLQLSPNPVNTNLTIDLLNEQFTLSIFDQTGKKVKSELVATGKYQLNCTDLSQGIYFIQAKNDKRILTSKFIKE